MESKGIQAKISAYIEKHPELRLATQEIVLFEMQKAGEISAADIEKVKKGSLFGISYDGNVNLNSYITIDTCKNKDIVYVENIIENICGIPQKEANKAKLGEAVVNILSSYNIELSEENIINVLAALNIIQVNEGPLQPPSDKDARAVAAQYILEEINQIIAAYESIAHSDTSMWTVGTGLIVSVNDAYEAIAKKVNDLVGAPLLPEGGNSRQELGPKLYKLRQQCNALVKIAEREANDKNPNSNVYAQTFNENYKKMFGTNFESETVVNYLKALQEYQQAPKAERDAVQSEVYKNFINAQQEYEKTNPLNSLSKDIESYAKSMGNIGGLADLGLNIALMYLSGGGAAIAKSAQTAHSLARYSVGSALKGVKISNNAKFIAQEAASILSSTAVNSIETSAFFNATKALAVVEDGKIQADEVALVGESFKGLCDFTAVGGLLAGPLGIKASELTSKLFNSERAITSTIKIAVEGKGTTLDKVLKALSENSNAISKITEFGTSFSVNAGYMAVSDGMSFDEAMKSLAQMDAVSKLVIAMLGGKNVSFLTPQKVQQIKTDLAGYQVKMTVFKGKKVYEVTDKTGAKTQLGNEQELFKFIISREISVIEQDINIEKTAETAAKSSETKASEEAPVDAFEPIDSVKQPSRNEKFADTKSAVQEKTATETVFQKLSPNESIAKLRKVLEGKDIDNDEYRVLVSIAKEFPEKAGFMADCIENYEGAIYFDQLCDFVRKVYKENIESKQADVLFKLALLASDKQSGIHKTDFLTDCINAEPEKLQMAYDLISSVTVDGYHKYTMFEFLDTIVKEVDVIPNTEHIKQVLRFIDCRKIASEQLKTLFKINPQDAEALIELNGIENSPDIKPFIGLSAEKIRFVKELLCIREENRDSGYKFLRWQFSDEEFINALKKSPMTQLGFDKIFELCNSKTYIGEQELESILALSDSSVERLVNIFNIKNQSGSSIYNELDLRQTYTEEDLICIEALANVVEDKYGNDVHPYGGNDFYKITEYDAETKLLIAELVKRNIYSDIVRGDLFNADKNTVKYIIKRFLELPKGTENDLYQLIQQPLKKLQDPSYVMSNEEILLEATISRIKNPSLVRKYCSDKDGNLIADKLNAYKQIYDFIQDTHENIEYVLNTCIKEDGTFNKELFDSVYGVISQKDFEFILYERNPHKVLKGLFTIADKLEGNSAENIKAFLQKYKYNGSDYLRISQFCPEDISVLFKLADKYIEIKELASENISGSSFGRSVDFIGEKLMASPEKAEEILSKYEIIVKNPKLLKYIASISPNIIDNNLSILTIIETLEGVVNPNDIHSMLNSETFSKPLTETDLEAFNILKKFIPNNSQKFGFGRRLQELFEVLNEDNIEILRFIGENYTSGKPIKAIDGFKSDIIEVSAESGIKFDIENIIGIMRGCQTKNDIDFELKVLKTGQAIPKLYDRKLSIDTRHLMDIKAKAPDIFNFVIDNDIKSISLAQISTYKLKEFNEYVKGLSQEQKSFLVKLFNIEKPDASTDGLIAKWFIDRCSYDETLQKYFKTIASADSNAQEIIVLTLNYLYKNASNFEIKDIAKLAKSLNKYKVSNKDKFVELMSFASEPESFCELPAILNAENTYPAEIYRQFMDILKNGKGLNVKSLSNIFKHSYNAEKCDYILKHMNNDSVFDTDSIITYLYAPGSSIDMLEYIKTSKHPLAKLYRKSGINKEEMSGLCVVNEIFNEIRTHGKEVSPWMTPLMSLSDIKLSDFKPELYRKLFRLYDSNGKHKIPVEYIAELACNPEMATKLLNEAPDGSQAIDLSRIKITQADADSFIRSVSNTWKLVLLNENGGFTANDYVKLINRLNENQLFRDAIKNFKETGKVDLEVFGDNLIIPALISNDKNLFVLAKALPELAESNPDKFKQLYSNTMKSMDIYAKKLTQYLKAHPALLQDNISAEDFVQALTSSSEFTEEIPAYAKIIDVVGFENFTKHLDKLDFNKPSPINELFNIIDKPFTPQMKKIFEMENVSEKELNTLIRLSKYAVNAKCNELTILPEDFAALLDAIIEKGVFDSGELLYGVYQGFINNNISGFETMTKEQLDIVAKYDLISNDKIDISNWSDFTKLLPEVQAVAVEMMGNGTLYRDIKKILDFETTKLEEIDYKDKINLVSTINAFSSKDIAILQKAGYGIVEKIDAISKSLDVEYKYIKTEPAKQISFLKHIITNNNHQSEKIFAECDFTAPEFEHGIPLKYSRAQFVQDIKNITAELSESDAEYLYKYFNINMSGNGFEGLPIIPEKPSVRLNATLQAKADKISEKIRAFTLNNEAVVSDTQLKTVLDSIIQGMPEFTTIIGKVQHGTHKYTVDIHMLKVLQQAINDPAYKNLSDKGKTILKLSILIHDLGKKEATVDKGHETLSAEYISSILQKFKLPEDVRFRIIDLVSNHHWFEHYCKGNLSPESMAALCRNPENFEISKIFAKADLMNVSEDFHYRITSTSSPEELNDYFNNKFKHVENKLQYIQEHANLIFDTKIMNNGDKFPIKKVMYKGQPEEFKVFDMTKATKEDFIKAGFFPETKAKDVRFITHMPTDNIDDLYGKMKMFHFLTYNSEMKSVQSTSLTSSANKSSYGGRKFGFILDIDQSDFAAASSENISSGFEKTFKRYTELLFGNVHGHGIKPFVRDNFLKESAKLGYDITEKQYALISNFLYEYKHISAIYSGFVNENVNPDLITEKFGFTKELYKEFVSSITSPERKAEIFDLCVGSKTYVFRPDGTIDIEYDSKTGGQIPEDGAFRMKAKDLRTILETSRDKLNTGYGHSEIVALNPRVQGLIAKVDKIEDCPEVFLQFAKEHDLPIILVVSSY